MQLNHHPNITKLRYVEETDEDGETQRIIVVYTDLPIPDDAEIGGDRPVELLLAKVAAAALRPEHLDAIALRPAPRVDRRRLRIRHSRGKLRLSLEDKT